MEIDLNESDDQIKENVIQFYRNYLSKSEADKLLLDFVINQEPATAQQRHWENKVKAYLDNPMTQHKTLAETKELLIRRLLPIYGNVEAVEEDLCNKWDELHAAINEAIDSHASQFIKNSPTCIFVASTNTSSATICQNCGQEKFMHFQQSEFIKKDAFIPIGEGKYGLPSAKQTHDEAMRLKQELKELGKDENFVDLNSWIMGANFMEEAALILLKKEVVSSDVEQYTKFMELLDNHLDWCLENNQPDTKSNWEQRKSENFYTLGLNQFFKSAQQPTTINWLTDDEIEAHYPERNSSGTYLDYNLSSRCAAKWVQKNLKERVNCVDPVEFAVFCSKYWKLIDENEPCWLNKNNHEVHKTEELMKAYQTSKINTNGKSK